MSAAVDPNVIAARRDWVRRVRETGTGYPCQVQGCGLDGMNVVHDPPWYRVNNEYHRRAERTGDPVPFHEFLGRREIASTKEAARLRKLAEKR